MKLKDYAKKLGISYQTAWNNFKANKIPGAYKTKTGSVIVPEETLATINSRGVIIYIRVVNSNFVPEKLEKITKWCDKRCYKVIETIIEFGDPWNSHSKIETIFNRNDWDYIIVEDFNDIFPIGHQMLKIISKNRIESVNKINVSHTPTPGQDMMNLIKTICLHSELSEEIANEKTEKIIRFILNELKSGN